MPQRTIGLLMAVTTALSWAVLAIALKAALLTYSSGTIVWVRMFVAALLMVAFFAFTRRHWLSILIKPGWQSVLCALLLAVNYYGYMKGVELTSASNAQILIQLAPLSFALSSIYLYREIPTRVQWLGMTVALAGFGFFFWDQILNSMDNLSRFQAGNLWILLAAGTWVVFALMQKSLLKVYAPQQLNMLVYLVSAIALAPTANFRDLANTTWPSALLMAFLAINTIIAYGALSEALMRIPAAHVSMIIAVNPLLTIFLMTMLTQMEVEWIHGEQIHWRGYLGALLVVTGVILTVRRRAALSPPPTPSTI
jgi:drug/metabolite transporter (DMT)-like permease